MNSPRDDIKDLVKFLAIYQSRKTRRVGIIIEQFKNRTVEGLMHRRGKFQKHVWHTSMIGLAGVGVMTSGVFGGTSIVSSSFPGVRDQDPRNVQTFDPFSSGASLESLIDMKTIVSEKPRSEVIEYEVKSGETLSQIAEKFEINVDTLRWANDLDSVHTIKPGDILKILPVNGVAYTVKSGDTLSSIAKTFSTEDQGILSYQFNDVPDDLKLRAGQVLIVPDGIPPSAKATPKPRTQYIAQGKSNSPTFSAPGGGNFIWPTTFSYISTYFAWWHPGVDMPSNAAPRVNASDGGTVIVAGWPDNYGYGNRVVIDHGNGYQSLYAHLSNVYVSTGQKVSRGQAVGQMGSTGRSTGIHLHFEIRFKGIAVNPLAILK